MSRIGRAAVALLGASVHTGSALMASPANAETPASAAVIKTLPIQADRATAKATVTYQCTDDATTVYYIRAILTQEHAYYGRGERLHPGTGILKATCTGKRVTEKIVLYTYEGDYQTGPLVRGTASFEFDLNSRDPRDPSYMGGPGTGPSVTSISTVKVLTSNWGTRVRGSSRQTPVAPGRGHDAAGPAHGVAGRGAPTRV